MALVVLVTLLASVLTVAAAGPAAATTTGTLTGTVQTVGQTGGDYPLDDVLVEARPSGSPDAAPTAWTTTAAGDFDLALPAGGYALTFTDLGPQGGWQDTVVGDVVVTAGATTTQPVVRLARLADATVTGLVVDGGAVAVPGASVTLLRRVAGPALTDPWVAVDTTDTGSDGRYTFTTAAVGRTYTVAASRPGSPVRHLGGARTAGSAATFAAAATNTVATIALPSTSVLTGSVTRGGAAAADVEVQAHEWRDGRFEPAGTDVTGDAGRFQVAVPGPGTYTLRYVDEQHDDAAWANGGSVRPTSLAAAGRTVTVQADGTTVDAGAFAFTAPPRGTGRVLAASTSGPTPLAGATVRVYAFDGTAWRPTGATATTGSTGTFDLALPRSGRATVRAVAAGFAATYWNGVPPTGAGTDRDSRPVAGGAAFGDLTLARRSTTSLGRVAGQDLATCRQHTLASGDGDASSGPVALPFPVRFFGTPQTEVFISDNGLVGFGSAPDAADYLPRDLTSLTQPVVAPFWADTDTRGDRSDQVTWGTSGDLLCVSWTDVGSFDVRDDKLNSVQLLITPATGADRAAGDVDVRFNYDQVQWDTGAASEGFPAVVGLTAGTGESGTTVQLAGSGTAGALLDGGPQALVAGSRGSTQPGRYVFEVRNAPTEPTEPTEPTGPTEPPAPVTPTNLVEPSISGTPKVGATLTADPGFWMPEDATPTYTWLRNGVAVPGASAATYPVGTADVGRTLAVRVTTGGGGYVTSAPVTSEAVTVPRVVSTSSARMVTATIRRTSRPRVTVRVAAAPVAPTGVVTIKANNVVRARVTLTAAHRGVATVSLPRLRAGRYSVRASYAGSAVVAGSTARAVTLTVRR